MYDGIRSGAVGYLLKGAAPEEYWLAGDDQEMVIPNKVVIGQMKRAKHVRYGQQLYQIGISLTPLGYIQLFHVPSLEITERFVQASDVDPDLDELYRVMMGSKDVEQHISEMNHYLLHKLMMNQKDTDECYQTDKRWTTNSRAWNRRVHRNLVMAVYVYYDNREKPTLVSNEKVGVLCFTC